MNYKLRIILAFILSGLSVIIGAFFKMMHWPFGTKILLYGEILLLVTFVFLIVKWAKKRQTNNSHTN